MPRFLLLGGSAFSTPAQSSVLHATCNDDVPISRVYTGEGARSWPLSRKCAHLRDILNLYKKC